MAPLVLKVKNDHAPFSSFSAVECEDDITQAWRVIHKVSNALEHGSRLENLSWRLWFRHQLMNRNGNHGHFAGLKEDTADLLDRGGYDLGSFGEQFWYGHEPKKKLSKMKKKQVIRPPPLSQPTAQHHHHHHQHLHPSQTHHPNIHTPSMMMQQQQQQAQQSLSSSATLMMQQPSEMHIDELLSHPARSLQHDHVTPEWAQTGQTSQQHHQSHPQQQQQQQQHSPRSAAFDTASIFAESAQSLQAALSMDFEDHGAASLLDQQNMLVDRMASFSVASPLSPTSRQTQPDGNALYMTTGGSMPPPPSATLGHKLYDHEQSMHRHQQLPHASSYNPTAESSHMMTSYSSSMQHTYTPQQEHHHTPSDETIPVQQQHIMSLLAEAGMFDGDPKQLHSTPPPQTAPNVMASSSSSSRSIQRIGVGYEDTDPRLNRSSTSEVFSDDDDDSTDDDSDDDTSSDSDSDASSDDTPICTNCGATSTPLWRRSNEDELLCNACGLYQKLHNAPRPKSLRPNNPRKETREDLTPKITCSNCGTNNTPLWRRDGEGAPLCNACGLYYKLHQEKRPLSMKTDTIKKRQRYEGGSGKKKKKRKKSKKSGSEEKHKKKKKRQKRIQEDHVDVSYSPTQPAASISSSSNTTMAPMAVTPSSSSSLLSNHPHHPQHQHHHHPSSVQQSPQPSPSSSTYALHQSPVSHTPPVSNFVTSATQLMLNFQAATANSAEVTPDFFQYQDYFGSSNFCPYFPDATSSASGQSTPQQHQSHHQQQ